MSGNLKSLAVLLGLECQSHRQELREQLRCTPNWRHQSAGEIFSTTSWWFCFASVVNVKYNLMVLPCSPCRTKAVELEVVEGEAVCRWCSNHGVDGLSCSKCDSHFCRKVFTPFFCNVVTTSLCSAWMWTWEQGLSSWRQHLRVTGSVCSASLHLWRSCVQTSSHQFRWTLASLLNTCNYGIIYCRERLKSHSGVSDRLEHGHQGHRCCLAC